MRAERVLMLREGLKNRPWFKHSLYAPGFYTGDGVKTMPGIREAIEQGEWSNVNGEIARVAEALNAKAALLKEAARCSNRGETDVSDGCEIGTRRWLTNQPGIKPERLH